MRKTTPRIPDRSWEQYEGGNRSTPSFFPRQDRSKIGRDHPSLKQAPSLHDLMADVMDCRVGVVQAPHQGILISDFGHPRKNFTDFNTWHISLDWFIRAANL